MDTTWTPQRSVPRIVTYVHRARWGARAQNGRFARFFADFLSFQGVLGSPGILRGVASISQGIGPNGGVATPFGPETVFSGCFRPAYFKETIVLLCNGNRPLCGIHTLPLWEPHTPSVGITHSQVCGGRVSGRAVASTLTPLALVSPPSSPTSLDKINQTPTLGHEGGNMGECVLLGPGPLRAPWAPFWQGGRGTGEGGRELK